MPNHKSAWKSIRQDAKRRERNKDHKSFLRKAVKAFKAVESAEEAKEKFPGIVSTIDKSVQKGIIHHRTAARMKSRLSKTTMGS
ncbi:MAG: 30S ribosomal protein S20 [Candidatus Krumholzibacteriota bacterium]|nr:30S ribosomal protein S20 [Candidatus Krumholzibacteriota bacterium]